MPSYQDAQLPADPTGQWLAFTAAVAVSPDTRDRLAHAITAHRAKIGTRWRLLDPTTQATLVIAFLRTNLTYAELAAGNHISTSTCWRYIQEGITLLAGRAMRLKDVVRLARKAGWDYLLVDGVNVHTICAPDGRLLWASAALPGRTTDITAARRHKLDVKIGKLIGLLADLGYLGLAEVLTGYRRKRGEKQLPAAKRAANKVHASLRCLGERGNAQLKWWRVLATELRCRPARCTRIVKAVLALHHLETAPFAA